MWQQQQNTAQVFLNDFDHPNKGYANFISTDLPA